MNHTMTITLVEGTKRIRIDQDISHLSIGGALDLANRTCNQHVSTGITKLESIYFYEEEGTSRYEIDGYQPLPRVGREIPPPKKQ